MTRLGRQRGGGSRAPGPLAPERDADATEHDPPRSESSPPPRQAEHRAEPTGHLAELTEARTKLTEHRAAPTEHRAELEEKKTEVAAELQRWRAEQGGFTSMSRTARAATELLAGDHRLQRFARQAGDPESTGPSALRLRMQQLQGKIELVDVAEARLARGEAPLREGEVGTDLVLDEIALALNRPLTREDLIAHRSAFLIRAIGEGKVEEALESYVSLAALYLEAPDSEGDSVHRAGGAPSLTALINGWALAGRLRTRGALVLTADDLERLQGTVVKLARRLEKAGELPPGTPPVTAERVAAEIDRLRGLEATPEIRELLEAGVERGHAAMKESTRGHKLSRFGRGVVRMLDDPSTWAMVLIGAVVGQVGRRAMLRAGSAAVEAGNVYAMKEADLLGKVGVQRFVATRAVEGVGFHVGMNAFEVARGKPERASWGLGDFARSVALFEVLGGVQIWQHARHIESAVLRHAANLGEETLGLSLLGLGEVWLRGGDGEDALELLEHNLQFLLAMRLLSGGRWALRGFTPEASQSIAQSKAEARREFRKARDPKLDLTTRGEHARAGYRATLTYHELLGREIEGLQEAESAKPGAPRPTPLRRDLDDSGLRAVAEAAGIDPALVEGVRAFYEPKSATTFFREGERAADASLQIHEDAHRRFVALDPAAAEEVVEAFRAADPRLDAKGVEELLAQHAAGELTGRALKSFEQILAREHHARARRALGSDSAGGVKPVGTTVADLLARYDLLVTTENRAAWAERSAKLRVPVKDSPARAAGALELESDDALRSAKEQKAQSGDPAAVAPGVARLVDELDSMESSDLVYSALEERFGSWLEQLEQLPPAELLATLMRLDGRAKDDPLFGVAKRAVESERVDRIYRRAAAAIDWTSPESLGAFCKNRCGITASEIGFQPGQIALDLAPQQLESSPHRGQFLQVLFEGLPPSSSLRLDGNPTSRQFLHDALVEYVVDVDVTDAIACGKVGKAIEAHGSHLRGHGDVPGNLALELKRALPEERRQDHGIALAQYRYPLGVVGIKLLASVLRSAREPAEIRRCLEPLRLLWRNTPDATGSVQSLRKNHLRLQLDLAYREIVSRRDVQDPELAALLVDFPEQFPGLRVKVPEEAQHRLLDLPGDASAAQLFEKLETLDPKQWSRLRLAVVPAFKQLLEASDPRTPGDFDRLLSVIKRAPKGEYRSHLARVLIQNRPPAELLDRSDPETWRWLVGITRETTLYGPLSHHTQTAILESIPEVDLATIALLCEQIRAPAEGDTVALVNVERALTDQLLQDADFSDDQDVALVLEWLGGRLTMPKKESDRARAKLYFRLFDHGDQQDLNNALAYLNEVPSPDHSRISAAIHKALQTEDRAELAARLTQVVGAFDQSGGEVNRRISRDTTLRELLGDSFSRLVKLSDLRRSVEREPVQRLAVELKDWCRVDKVLAEAGLEETDLAIGPEDRADDASVATITSDETPELPSFATLDLPDGAGVKRLAEALKALDEKQWESAPKNATKLFLQLLEKSDLRSLADLERILEVVRQVPDPARQKALANLLDARLLKKKERFAALAQKGEWQQLLGLSREKCWSQSLSECAARAIAEAVAYVDVATLESLWEQVRPLGEGAGRRLPGVERALTRRLLTLTDFGDATSVARALGWVKAGGYTDVEPQQPPAVAGGEAGGRVRAARGRGAQKARLRYREMANLDHTRLLEKLFGHGGEQDISNALAYVDAVSVPNYRRINEVVEQGLQTDSRVELTERLTQLVDALATTEERSRRIGMRRWLAKRILPGAVSRLCEMSDLSRVEEREPVQRLAAAVSEYGKLTLSDEKIELVFGGDGLFPEALDPAFDKALDLARSPDKLTKLRALAQLRRSMLDSSVTDQAVLRDRLEQVCDRFANDWGGKGSGGNFLSGLFSMMQAFAGKPQGRQSRARQLQTNRARNSETKKAADLIPKAEARAFFESIIKPAYLRLAEIGDYYDGRTIRLLVEGSQRFNRATGFQLSLPAQSRSRLLARTDPVKDIVRASQIARSKQIYVRNRAEREIKELSEQLRLVDGLKLRKIAAGKVELAGVEVDELDTERLGQIAEQCIKDKFNAARARDELLEEGLSVEEQQQRFFLVAEAFQRRLGLEVPSEASFKLRSDDDGEAMTSAEIEKLSAADTVELSAVDAAFYDKVLIPTFSKLVDRVDWADGSEDGILQSQRLLAFAAGARRFDRELEIAPRHVETFFDHIVDGYRDFSMAMRLLVHPDRVIAERAEKSVRQLFGRAKLEQRVERMQRLERVVRRSSRTKTAGEVADRPWTEVVSDSLEAYDHPALRSYRALRGELFEQLRTLPPEEAIPALCRSLVVSAEVDLMVDDLVGRGEEEDGWIDGRLLGLAPDYGTGKLSSPATRLLIAAVATFPQDPTALVDFLQGRIDNLEARTAGGLAGNYYADAESYLERLKQEWEALDPRLQRPLLERAFTKMLEEVARRRESSPGERDRFREVIEERVVRIFDRDPDAKKLSERVCEVTEAFPPYLQARIVANLLTSPPTEEAPQLLRQLLVAAGPVAVKAGQQMCEDPRIPKRFRDVLEDLRDNNATMTPMLFWTLLPPEIRSQVASLGPSRGTGSVKQVNMARLTDGREAVAAVVRPGVEQDIAESIGALGVVEETRHLVARIEPMLQREIDLISEGASFETLRATPVGQCPQVGVPKVIATAPRAILREDAPGETVAAILRERQLTPGERARLAEVHRLLVRSALDTEQGWFDRFRNRAPDEEVRTYVLSDPHQGNLADDGAKLGLFDPGQYEELRPAEADYFVRLLAAFSKARWMRKQRATLITELSELCRLSETATGDEDVRSRLDRAWESLKAEPDAIPERRLQLLLLDASKNGVAVPNGYFGLAKMLHSLQAQEMDLGLEPIVENTIRDLRLDQLGPLGRLVKPFV